MLYYSENICKTTGICNNKYMHVKYHGSGGNTKKKKKKKNQKKEYDFVLYLNTCTLLNDNTIRDGKLSEEENANVQDICGRSPAGEGIVRMQSKLSDFTTNITRAVAISPRHVLVGRSLGVDDNFELSGTKYDKTTCVNGNMPLLPGIKLFLVDKPDIAAKKSVYIGDCASSFGFIVVEIDHGAKPVCIPRSLPNIGDKVEMHSGEDVNADVTSGSVTEILNQVRDKTYFTTSPEAHNGNGVVLAVNNKVSSAIGIMYTKGANSLRQLSVYGFRKEICDFTGLCEVTGALSKHENALRKKNCGKKPDSSSGVFFARFSLTSNTYVPLISSRHLIRVADPSSDTFGDNVVSGRSEECKAKNKILLLANPLTNALIRSIHYIGDCDTQNGLFVIELDISKDTKYDGPYVPLCIPDRNPTTDETLHFHATNDRGSESDATVIACSGPEPDVCAKPKSGGTFELVSVERCDPDGKDCRTTFVGSTFGTSTADQAQHAKSLLFYSRQICKVTGVCNHRNLGESEMKLSDDENKLLVKTCGKRLAKDEIPPWQSAVKMTSASNPAEHRILSGVVISKRHVIIHARSLFGETDCVPKQELKQRLETAIGKEEFLVATSPCYTNDSYTCEYVTPNRVDVSTTCINKRARGFVLVELYVGEEFKGSPICMPAPSMDIFGKTDVYKGQLDAVKPSSPPSVRPTEKLHSCNGNSSTSCVSSLESREYGDYLVSVIGDQSFFASFLTKDDEADKISDGTFDISVLSALRNLQLICDFANVCTLANKYDWDEPMPEDFPREVYGKALLAGWIENMTLLPSILNILYLERGLVDGTISPQNVTNQMVGHNVDYEIIKSYGSNLMLTGSWEYRNFLALFEKRKPWSGNEEERRAFEHAFALAYELNGELATMEAVTSDVIDGFPRFVENLNTSSPDRFANFTDDGSVGGLVEWLAELHELAPKDQPILDRVAVVEWFDKHKGNTATLSAAQTFSKKFFENNAKKDFSLFHKDAPGIVRRAVVTVRDAYHKLSGLQLSLADAKSYETDVQNLEMMLKDGAASDLRNLLNYAKRGRDSCSAIPSLLDDVGRVSKQKNNQWIRSLIKGRPTKKLFNVMEPFLQHLEFFKQFGKELDDVCERVEKYYDTFEHLFFYMDRITFINETLPAGDVLAKFEDVRKCLEMPLQPEDLRYEDSALSSWIDDFKEIDKIIDGPAKVCNSLRRIADPKVTEAFANPNTHHIEKTVADSIWHIDYEMLRTVKKEIGGVDFCAVPSDIANVLSERHQKQGGLSVAPLSETFQQSKTKIESSGVKGIILCLNKTSVDEIQRTLDASREVWHAGRLDDVRYATYIVQALGMEGYGENVPAHVATIEGMLRNFGFPVRALLKTFKITKEEIRKINEGLDAFRNLIEFYDRRETMRMWNTDLSLQFKYIQLADVHEVKRQWDTVYDSFNTYLDGLSNIEYRLYTAHNDSLLEHIKILEIAANLSLPFFQTDKLFDQQAFGELSALHWFVGFQNGHTKHQLKLKRMIPVLRKVHKWLHNKFTAEEDVAEEVDEWERANCWCDENMTPDHICFSKCDTTWIDEKLAKEDAEQREFGEKLHFWLTIVCGVVSIHIAYLIARIAQLLTEDDRPLQEVHPH
ncbi:unnamed protein product [Caenorhabditis sp. 36 PRJEB53466]|nr:unnamed protein product [Caenorhabditis sp. 36 PRJEB53466]